MLRPALTLALLLPGCAIPPGHVPAESMLAQDVVELPSQYRNGYFLVRASLDGQGPYAFLVDTGTDRLVVDTRLANRHRRAVRSANLSVRSATGCSATMDQVLRIRTMTIGAAMFRRLEAGVLDLSSLSQALGARIDGLLGCSVFADCLLTLDYPDRRIWIEKGALPPPDGQQVLATTGSTPWVEGTLAGRSMRFLLDSGFGREVTLPPDMPGMDFAGPPRAWGQVVTISGSQTQYLARVVGALELGTHRIRRPQATLTPGSPKIGARLLRRFVVTLDFENRRVRLAR